MKIIADIGSNWTSLKDCVESINLISNMGVDAAKFQYFDHKKLYGFDGPMRPGLYREWVDVLAHECDKKYIEFMCSVFDPDDVPMIAEYCTTFKVASPEISDIDLLTEYAKIFDPSKHEIYISTGCATLKDLDTADRLFQGHQTFMACDSSYPAKGLPINHISYLYYNYSDFGISDHSKDQLKNIRLARMLECKAYEKHFRLEKIGSNQSPDYNHSLSNTEWWTMMLAYKDDSFKARSRPFKRKKVRDGWYRSK